MITRPVANVDWTTDGPTLASPEGVMSNEQQVIQVVSGDGEFNENGVRQFVSAAHIDTAGVDYQTIAITGPQSSGKSTLMNALVRY